MYDEIVKELVEKKWSAISKKPNVIGYSGKLQLRETNGKLIPNTRVFRVYVVRKLPESCLKESSIIPRCLSLSNKQIETDVVKIGKLTAPPSPYNLSKSKLKKLDVDKTAKIRPVPLGVSIGNWSITAGSLGMLYKVKEDNKLGITPGINVAGTNAHVASDGPEKEPAEVVEKRILQPGCFSEDTRVLTENGWKYFKDLEKNERVYTLNKNTNEIELQLPTNWFIYNYNGPMIHYKGQMYDFLVTPEHNIFCKIYSNRHKKKTCFKHNWGINKAKDIIDFELELKKDGIWNCDDITDFNINGIKIDSSIWLEFLGWYLSEGCLSKGKNGNYSILIAQNKNSYWYEIANLLNRMNMKYYYNKKSCQFQFNNKRLWEYLREFGKAGDKFIPKEIKMLPPNKLCIFLLALFKGDGSFKNGALRRYYSKSKKLCDDVLEVLIKIGLSGKISSRKQNGTYSVSVNQYNLTPRTTKMPIIQQYNGLVYDVTVPNHILMIERNGCPVWSGNSYHGGKTESNIVGTYVWHQRIFPDGIPSECTITKLVAKIYNKLSKQAGRHARLSPVSVGENNIDFAVYLPSTEHIKKVADNCLDEEPFIGHLFAGSEAYGIICKVKYIIDLGLEPLVPIAEVKVGDTVRGCSFWCHYTTTVFDDSGVITVSYGDWNATFTDVIIVSNDGSIRGGCSGSGYRKLNV